MSGSGAIEDIKAEIMRAAEAWSIKIAGIHAVSPAAASDLKAQLVELFSPNGGAMTMQPSLHVVEAVEKHSISELEEFIFQLLRLEDRPMSLEQIYDVIEQSSDFDNNKQSLAVQLHRTAKKTGTKIIRTSRGHYWVPESARQVASR